MATKKASVVKTAPKSTKTTKPAVKAPIKKAKVVTGKAVSGKKKVKEPVKLDFNKTATRTHAKERVKEEGIKATKPLLSKLAFAMECKRTYYAAKRNEERPGIIKAAKTALLDACKKAGFDSVALAKDAARAFGVFDAPATK